jgi:hypothetical protein
MPTIAKGSKVLVSGANGYIAMWVARILLERGYSVRGTVRSADKGKFMSDYFVSLGYGDQFEAVVVEDIVKVRFFCSCRWTVAYVSYRKEHLMKQSREWTRLNTWHPLSIRIRKNLMVKLSSWSGGLELTRPLISDFFRPAIQGTVGILKSALKNGSVSVAS